MAAILSRQARVAAMPAMSMRVGCPRHRPPLECPASFREFTPMSASLIDSEVFRHIFTTEPMRRVFSDEARVQYYLDIEAALARVQGRLGIIPQNAADEIVRHCSAAQFDMAKLKTQTERIGYPVLPVV